MEEEILGKFPDAKIEMKIGGRGDFIVEVDDKIIFSKKELSPERFPENGEILKLI